MNIVLHEPEIPFNTGAIGRTCVATNTTLHLIKPYGFILNSKNVKKAGMDYWPKLKLREHLSYTDFLKEIREKAKEKDCLNGLQDCASIRKEPFQAATKPQIWYATTKAKQTYTEVSFSENDYIMFGKESAGIPEEFWIRWNTHIIALGRTLCTSQKPKCELCYLNDLCPSVKGDPETWRSPAERKKEKATDGKGK